VASISGALGECLSGLEFVRAAGWRFDEAGSRASPAGADSPEVPTSDRLGDYRILREVGRGSMGVVYEAEQVSLGRRVALKVLPFASAIDPRQRQRFLIEAQAAAQLHHPHIVPVFAAGCDRGVDFYAMQFVDGQTLAELVGQMRRHEAGAPGSRRAPGPRPLDDHPALGGDAPTGSLTPTASLPHSPAGNGHGTPAPGPVHGVDGAGSLGRRDFHAIARLGMQAAEALEHAHSLGVVHRDVKPANLMVDLAGELWITDFGLARFRGDSSLTRSGDIVGTLRYMSPEQALARRGVVDQRTDIYALGLTLYELLTLRPAFDAREHHELLRQIAMDEPVPPRRIDPTIPRDLETIVLKAACKEPSGRYATARELADDLARFLEDRPILARRPNLMERGVRWARRHRQIVVTAGTVLVLAMAVGGVLLGIQVKKTEWQAKLAESVSQQRLTYIKGSFPFIDEFTVNYMGAMSGQVPAAGQADPAIEVYKQALQLYEQASSIPATDPESRMIIARAYRRMGFTRAVWAYRKNMNAGLLAQAEEAYRESIRRFEELLAERPDDPEVRRWFADALAEWGLGWFLATTNRGDEAEPYLRRALELRRELVLDPAVEPSLVSRELLNLSQLTNMLAENLVARRRGPEAEAVRRQLETICTTLSECQTSPGRRRALATQLVGTGTSLVEQNSRKDGTEMLRLALIIDPDNAEQLNTLAWHLASAPDAQPYEPARALEMARKAVTLEPGNWMYWNTLGVAAYRVGDWKAASEALEKSISLKKGKEDDASDWLFLAMTRWRQNNPGEARKCYDRAAALIEKNPGKDPQLPRFQAEATELLGIHKASSGSKPPARG
jgi:serine/threonine protein kinase/Tfp pilus assembly protein PilF